MAFEQLLDGQEPLLEPLGIVDPVHPDHHRPEHARGGRPIVVGDGHGRVDDLGETLGVDPDREGHGPHRAAEGAYASIAQHLAPGLVHHIAVEGLQPVASLEADQVVVEQAFHQLAVMGQGGQQLPPRPGDVQEEAYPVAAAHLAQLPRQRDQVVVVHPDDVVGPDQRAHRLGETAVHPLIALAERAFIVGQVDTVVKQRPQHGVSVAVVVFLDVLLFQVEGRHRHPAPVLHVRLAGEGLHRLATPAEPDALVAGEGRGERHRQAAHGGAALFRHGDAVRDDHQA